MLIAKFLVAIECRHEGPYRVFNNVINSLPEEYQTIQQVKMSFREVYCPKESNERSRNISASNSSNYRTGPIRTHDSSNDYRHRKPYSHSNKNEKKPPILTLTTEAKSMTVTTIMIVQRN